MISEIAAVEAPASLPWTANYRVWKWEEKGRTVYFSACRQGDGMPIHLAAVSRKDKRALRRALNAFCEHLFDTFGWCQMVMGVIGPRSVVNLATKCGFIVMQELDSDAGPITLVARPRSIS